MIRHIVCFKLADKSKENIERTADVLKSMEGKIDLIRSIEVGIDLLHSERSYDIILQVVLDDFDALDAYQKDAYHCDIVKKHMHAVSESSISIDYEI